MTKATLLSPSWREVKRGLPWMPLRRCLARNGFAAGFDGRASAEAWALFGRGSSASIFAALFKKLPTDDQNDNENLDRSPTRTRGANGALVATMTH